MCAQTPREPAVRFIFVTLVLLVLGFGILIPVLPGLVTEFEHGNVSQGSHTFGWLIGTFALVQFVASPILGALSDKYGRRRVLLIALAGAAVDYVIMGLAPTLAWLFIGRLISGATAGALSTCNAYIADVTPPERRAQGYGMVGAAFGLGFIIGPLIGGVLGSIHLRLPFFAAAVCVGINWVYGMSFLPESLPVERRREFSWKRANPVGSLLLLGKFRGVAQLASMHFVYIFGTAMLQNVWVLYMSYRFNWSPRQVGFSLAFVGLITVLVQARLIQPILSRLGERRGLVAGLITSSIVFIGYGSATHGWMIYALISVGALGGIVGPAAQSLITKHVPGNEQGAVQGTLSGLQSLANIFAPLLAAWSFGIGIAPGARWHQPGIPFFEAAALFVVAVFLALRSFRADDAVQQRIATASTG